MSNEDAKKVAFGFGRRVVWIAREGSLGIYLVWKGFKTTKVISLDTSAPAAEPSMAAVLRRLRRVARRDRVTF
jgi:hypothetical protein